MVNLYYNERVYKMRRDFPKVLDDRTHSCDCRLVIDRNENITINILRRGLASIGDKTLEAPCESRVREEVTFL
jgi:transposase